MLGHIIHELGVVVLCQDAEVELLPRVEDHLQGLGVAFRLGGRVFIVHLHAVGAEVEVVVHVPPRGEASVDVRTHRKVGAGVGDIGSVARHGGVGEAPVDGDTYLALERLYALADVSTQLPAIGLIGGYLVAVDDEGVCEEHDVVEVHLVVPIADFSVDEHGGLGMAVLQAKGAIEVARAHKVW